MSALTTAFIPLLQAIKEFLIKDDKINTVMIVVLIVFIGIAVYLLFMGRKLNKMEKEVEELKQNAQQNNDTNV